MGFSQRNVLEGKESLFESDTTSSVDSKYDSIYCYTDIIQNKNAGDYNVPLLRIIPINTSHGSIICIRYNKPHFLPISSRLTQGPAPDPRSK